METTVEQDKEIAELVKKTNLKHIAIIMDGNRRWAKQKGLPSAIGHKKGVDALKKTVYACDDYGIKYITVYAFSTENWNRPQDEIDHLMDYLELFFQKEIDYLDSVGARILVSGDLSRIREKTRKVCYESMERTKANSTSYLNVCLNYGGRDEIVRAAKKIAIAYQNGSLALDNLNEETFKQYLWQPLLPDVDLMIRTSGEERISNFLLYENAYAEFVFTPVKWPDFKRDALIDCLKEYQARNRRFGGLKNE